jgi:hypothetical protein
MLSARWWLGVLAWDGALPFLVACVPLAVRSIFPPRDPAGIVVILLVPIGAALIRAQVACYQIARICDGAVPRTRQAAMAAAIVVLLYFEFATGAVVCSGDALGDLWLIPVVTYVGYLSIIAWALRPVRAC